MSDINKKEIHLKAFSELKGKIFHIPYQQRGYKWTCLLYTSDAADE